MQHSNQNIYPIIDDKEETKADVQMFAIILTLLSALFSSIWTVNMTYLERQGLIWIQVFAFGEFSNLCYSLLLWYTYSKIKYNKEIKSETITNINNTPFKEYLFSIFPSKTDKRAWKLLFARGVCNAFSFQCYVIGLIYCDAGDSMLIRTTLTSFGVFIIGVLKFGEKFTILVLVSFVFAVGGLILICRPTFIFGSADIDGDHKIDPANPGANELNPLGLMLILFSALFRISSKAIIKKSGKLNVHWIVMNIITFCVTNSVAVIEYIILGIYYNGINKHIWYNWLNHSESGLVTFCIIIYGIIFVCKVSFTVIGHQIGDIGRLGIISNSDIVFTYGLGYFLLNEQETRLVIAGAVFVSIGIGILFLENAKKKREKAKQKQQEMLLGINNDDNEKV